MVAARVFFVALLALWMLPTSAAFSAEIKVFVDQQALQADQSFQLFFEATGSVDEEPDFSPLEQDFEIRGRTQSNSISIINGSYSNKKNWTLTLLAKGSGNVKIPPIAFGRDSSPPLALTINAGDSAAQPVKSAELFLQVRVEPKTAYVQQQLTYQVQLFRQVEIANASLSEPEFGNSDCLVEKLGKDREFETIRDGHRYLVIERQYALFPQQSGPLLIEPLRFEGQLLQNQRSFFGAINQPGPIKRLQSAPISLQIKPIPAAYQGRHWLPAEKLQLSENWSTAPEQLVVGEPTTRTLTLSAAGLLSSQLPQLSAGDLAGFKVYPDQPLLENNLEQQPAVALRQEKLALIPTRAGTFQLPEIRIDWWNSLTDQPETTILPTTTLRVAPAPAGQAHQQAFTANQPPAPSAQTPVAAPEPGPAPTNLWPLLATLLAGGWLLTALAWWRCRRRPARENLPAAPLTSAAQAAKRLKNACQSNEPAQARSALLDWGKQCWPQQPALNLTAIGNRCGAAVAQEIDRLNQALYAPGSHHWDGQSLWQAFQQQAPAAAAERKPKTGPLKDLHP